jgi:serine/threonine-protein kinase
VLDFGIARSDEGTSLTQTVSVLGTAAYMAPEQASGERADARSDIYSLGCVLYAMLSGAPPFTGDLAAAVLHQHVNIAPWPLDEAVPGAPRPLARLVDQMLAKSPSERPQTAGEVRDRLRALLDPTAPTVAMGGNGVAVGGAVAAAAAALGRGVAAAAATRPLAPPRRRPRMRRGPLVAIVILVILIAAGALSSGSKLGRHNLFPTHTSTTTPKTTPKAPAAPKSATAPARATPPPGHGGPPPGQAKKQGNGNGDGNDNGNGDGGD